MNDHVVNSTKKRGEPCEQIRMIGRVVDRHYDQALQSVGITAAQYILLREMEHETKAADISQVHCIEKSTLSRNLKRLQERGLVEQGARMGRRGCRPLNLTEAGRELLQKATPIWQRASVELERAFGMGSHTLSMINTLARQAERLAKKLDA